MVNGVRPGGGFLTGAGAQEESLCRSSALYATLVTDPMYATHARRPLPDSTAWAILSPDVPVVRDDLGDTLDQEWLGLGHHLRRTLRTGVGQPAAGELLDARIGRLLQFARAFGYTTVVLRACAAERSATTQRGPPKPSDATSSTLTARSRMSSSPSPTARPSVAFSGLHQGLFVVRLHVIAVATAVRTIPFTQG